jgi:hypothetical protein
MAPIWTAFLRGFVSAVIQIFLTATANIYNLLFLKKNKNRHTFCSLPRSAD